MSQFLFFRFFKVLAFIQTNLYSSLSLNDIAKQSCWSRWQLQRVFQSQTGMSVANYTRELKLSVGAEWLLDTNKRVIDIAIEFGFSSEISFSRAFKQKFGISPSMYRKRAQRIGLKKPIEVSRLSYNGLGSSVFLEVRVDTKEEFILKGVRGEINGLFSSSPNFSQVVPKLWQQLEFEARDFPRPEGSLLGIIDVTKSDFDGSSLDYWAGIRVPEEAALPELPSLYSNKFEVLSVPKQTYAVVKHRGPVLNLPKTIEWFILSWLPNSGYRGIDGYELEIYPESYQPASANAEMEYWLPIEKISDT
ncbi:AraC family transcriptional regulator [Vibrio caribbeanicus]|uniref:AraC family transcriptional regulator n=1 Tax=Vibrio caribbeanicus TaxID=701175 RepID=UPI003BB741B5